MSCADWTKAQLGRNGEEHAMEMLRNRLPQGFAAAFTATNTKDVDIAVRSPDGSLAFNLQVKARCAAKNRNWTLSRRHEDVRDEGLFYCLVAFRDDDEQRACCWIVPSNILATCVSETHAAYREQSGCDNNRRHVREDMARRIPKYGPGWLDPFLENWALLGL